MRGRNIWAYDLFSQQQLKNTHTINNRLYEYIWVGRKSVYLYDNIEIQSSRYVYENMQKLVLELA